MSEKEHLRLIGIFVIIEYIISFGFILYEGYVDFDFGRNSLVILLYLAAAMSVASFVMAIKHLITFRNEHTGLAILFLVLSLVVLLCSMCILVIVVAFEIICGGCKIPG